MQRKKKKHQRQDAAKVKMYLFFTPKGVNGRLFTMWEDDGFTREKSYPLNY